MGDRPLLVGTWQNDRMFTITVPTQEIADAVGDLGDGAQVVVWDPTTADAPEDLRESTRIVCIPHYSGGRKVFSRFDALPNLAVIQIPSAGYEHAIPFVPPGVALANARGVHDTRTAEFAIALALASQRMMPTWIENQERGAWNPQYFHRSLADRKALVVGYGSIGTAIGARLRALEVEVEGVARTARTAPDGTIVHAATDLLRLLPDAEVVFIITPYDSSTDKLVDAEFLAAMPDDALLVNVARGKIVDTEALIAECASGRLRAAVDVIDPEPLPTGHPAWSTPNLIVAPHVAGGAELTDRRYISLVRAQVESIRAGGDGVNVVAVGAYGA